MQDGLGCKLAVCPMERGRRRHSFGDDPAERNFSGLERSGDRDESQRVENALDLGIALLVKAFPLARVATSYSCDGHGVWPASIHLFFPWDVIWAKAVFTFLNVPTPNSRWNWTTDKLTTDELTIEPLGGYSDAGVLAMLHDIQASARSLLNQDLIDKLGEAHSKLLETTGERFDDLAYFADEAGRQAQGCAL